MTSLCVVAWLQAKLSIWGTSPRSPLEKGKTLAKAVASAHSHADLQIMRTRVCHRARVVASKKWRLCASVGPNPARLSPVDAVCS